MGKRKKSTRKLGGGSARQKVPLGEPEVGSTCLYDTHMLGD